MGIGVTDSTLTSTNRYREIRKLLTANVGAKRLAHVFDDFIEMAALAFRNSVDLDGRDEREQLYLRIAGQYTVDELHRFAQSLTLVVEEMEASPSDVLGRLYMELELGNEHLGQFFTPYDVARVIAGMTMDTDSMRAMIAERGFITVYEPACGAGAFMVALTQQMRAAGIDYQRCMHVTAEDVSAQAVHMAYIHLTLLHVPAVVYRRNSLTLQTFDAWPTPAHVLGLWGPRLRQRHIYDEPPTDSESAAAASPAAADTRLIA